MCVCVCVLRVSCFVFRPPNLVVVIVGDDPASIKYVANKTKAAKKCGVASDTIVKPASISQDDLLALVDQLNQDDTVSWLFLLVVSTCVIYLCCKYNSKCSNIGSIISDIRYRTVLAHFILHHSNLLTV